jgi:GNAT superfamily N-acetyltransferase
MASRKPRITLMRPTPEHAPELGRIGHEAFKELYDRLGLPLPGPSAAAGQQAVEMFMGRGDIYSVAALLDGKPVGSNFMWLLDAVAGIGPLTVDPACQGQGIGRALMRDALAHAKREGIEQVRLMQDSFNAASLSLYASLGFAVKEAVAYLHAVPAAASDPTIRPVTAADLPTIEDLSTRIYRVSRRNEAAAASELGSTPLLRERAGRVTGYFMAPSGHGVAETEDDALALIGEAAVRFSPRPTRFYCPLSEAALYRKALRAGHRTIKVMNLMALGPYEPPTTVWMPSVLY